MNEDNIIKMISSFGISFGVITILGIPLINSPYFILGTLGTSVLLTPVVYFIVKKNNERWYKKEEARLKSVQQTFANMIEEGYGKDKIIEKTTTNFYSKVEAMQKDFNISLEPNDFDQINDFLY